MFHAISAVAPRFVPSLAGIGLGSEPAIRRGVDRSPQYSCITSECGEVDEDVQPTLDEARWPAATSVFSAKAPMPSAGATSDPSVRVIFWVAVRTRQSSTTDDRACSRTGAADGPQVEDHVVAGRQCVYAIANRFDDASGFVSE